MYCALRRAGTRAATPRSTLSLHLTRHEDERRDRGYAGRLDGRDRCTTFRPMPGTSRRTAARTMPYCVLLEAALQPCGWLASYIGSALSVEERGVLSQPRWHCDPRGRALRGRGHCCGPQVTLTNVSQSAGMIIVSFDVECFLSSGESGRRAGERRVYVMDTVFGFFPPEALSLENQVGQPTTAISASSSSAQASGNSTSIFRGEPARYFAGSICVWANRRLRTLDRVTGYWPEGGTEGLGRVRAERKHRRGRLVLQGALLPGSGAARIARHRGDDPGASVLHAGARHGRRRRRMPRFEPIGSGAADDLEVPRAGRAPERGRASHPGCDGGRAGRPGALCDRECIALVRWDPHLLRRGDGDAHRPGCPAVARS